MPLINPFLIFKYFSHISRICRVSVCPLVMRSELYRQVTWGDTQEVDSPKGLQFSWYKSQLLKRFYVVRKGVLGISPECF
jgi:hypothetical protein